MCSTPAEPDWIDRREAMLLTGAVFATALVEPGSAQAHPTSEGPPVTITCFIRYQIDPFQKEAFRAYAEAWGSIIPRCGGHLLGYFLPWEGTDDIAWGLIAFDSLASYEAYRTRLKADPQGRANLAMAQSKRLILREERNFVEVVDTTFERPAQAHGAGGE